MRLKDHVAIVTGGGGAVGGGIATCLAQEGADIVVSDINLEAAEIRANKLKEIGRRVITVRSDITVEKDCQSLIRECLKTFGKIDILVLNAASNPYYGPLKNIPDEAFDKIMNNNVKSNLWMANMFLPHMETLGGGKVIVISSIAGITGSSVLGAYSISKTADLGLVRSLAAEWGPKNITVNALCPGLIKTDFARALWEDPKVLSEIEANAPLRRIGVPDEVAGAAVLLASEAGAFITGQKIVMDGGVTITS